MPTPELARLLEPIAGITAEVVNLDEGGEPPLSTRDVDFYVPPFFPRPAALGAIAAMPALAVIQALTAGVDRLLPVVPPGVTLCNARGAHDASTAEWVVAAMLASIRRMPFFAAEQAAGRWSYRGTGTLAGSRVLIVGYGSIGAAVERRLDGFEVTVERVARTARDGVRAVAELPALLPAADVVVILAPVTPETIGMVGAGFLALMKDGALLVNAARGVLVDTAALVAELSSGRLAAALDVTDPEPLPAGHPLWTAPNVLITPHVAATTEYSARSAGAFLVAQVRRFAAGQPLANVVTGLY